MFVQVQAQIGKNDEVNLRHLQEAVLAIGDGNLRQADTILSSMLARNPQDADALNLLGVVRAEQTRSTEAERLFQRSLRASPTHVGAHINLGQLYINTNRKKLALQVLLAGHKLAPGRVEINLKLAELFSEAGDYQNSMKYLRLIEISNAPPDYFPLMMKALVKLNRLEEARQLARLFKESSAEEIDTAIKFAMAAAGGGLSAEAIEILETKRQSGQSFPILYALGIISVAAKSYDKAEEYLTAALAERPDDVPTLRALASVARTNGNFEKALAYLVRARRVSPEEPDVLYDFGATAMQMGLLLDALPVFKRLYTLAPRRPAYIYALAAAQIRKGELKEAERLARSFIGLRPDDGAGFHLLGATLYLLNRYAEAQATLERSLKLRPDVDAHYLLGLTLYEQGNRALAIEMLRRVVSQRPEHAAAQAALGTAYRDLGRFSEALVALERSVELDPKDLRASYQLGLVYAKLGNKEAAQKMFDRADQLRAQERERETIILKLIEPPQN